MREKSIITFEEQTLEELQSFGIDEKGRFSGRGNHDDIAMSCVNLVNYFDSNDFFEHVEEMIDNIDEEKQEAIFAKFENFQGDTDHMDTVRWLGSQG
jgi:hypothetical protein